MTSESKLTHMEAYKAMFSFLEEYYKRTGSDDVGSLLSGMCLMVDGAPMDKAYINEWQEAISRVLNDTVDVEVRFNDRSENAN